MKRTNFPKRALATALIAALGLSQAASAREPQPAPKDAPTHRSDGSMRLQQTMSGHQKLPMTGDVDQDFASMMIVHHQQAVDMVDILAKEGRDAELKAMGQRMKTAQQGEIRQLSKFARTPASKAGSMAQHEHGDEGVDHAKAMDAHFKEMDGNHDGNISRAEFDAHHRK